MGNFIYFKPYHKPDYRSNVVPLGERYPNIAKVIHKRSVDAAKPDLLIRELERIVRYVDDYELDGLTALEKMFPSRYKTVEQRVEDFVQHRKSKA